MTLYFTDTLHHTSPSISVSIAICKQIRHKAASVNPCCTSIMSGMFFDHFCSTLSPVLCVLFSPGSAEAQLVRWELERSFDRQFCQEYSYQKLLKSGNLSASYNQ